MNFFHTLVKKGRVDYLKYDWGATEGLKVKGAYTTRRDAPATRWCSACASGAPWPPGPPAPTCLW